MVVAAVNASCTIRLEPGRLAISRVLGSRTLDLGEITAATPLLVGGIESGLILELRDHSRVRLPWDNLVNYQLLLEALRNAGIKVQSASRIEAGQAEPGPPATGEISWEFNAPLLTNQFIMYDLLKVWGFSTLFLGLLMAGIAVYDQQLAHSRRYGAGGGGGKRRSLGAADPGNAGVFRKPVSHGVQARPSRGHGGQPQPARALGQSPGRDFRRPGR